MRQINQCIIGTTKEKIVHALTFPVATGGSIDGITSDYTIEWAIFSQKNGDREKLSSGFLCASEYSDRQEVFLPVRTFADPEGTLVIEISVPNEQQVSVPLLLSLFQVTNSKFIIPAKSNGSDLRGSLGVGIKVGYPNRTPKCMYDENMY